MIDYEELAEAMGDLDEDTVKELLETVMADAAPAHSKRWMPARREWTSSAPGLRAASISLAT